MGRDGGGPGVGWVGGGRGPEYGWVGVVGSRGWVGRRLVGVYDVGG